MTASSPSPSPAPPTAGISWRTSTPIPWRCCKSCRLEPGLASAAPGSFYQFERQGYFCADQDSAPGAPVFNRTVTLKDPWARIQQKGAK